MKITGRITTSKVDVQSLTAELREAGYKVDVMPDGLIDNPDYREEYAHVEASRDVAVTSAAVTTVCDETLTELNDIAERHGRGICWECGPVPSDHVPHNYETPHWRGEGLIENADAPAPDDDYSQLSPERQEILKNSPWVAARRELVQMGLVRDSGKRRNGMIVWELTPLGKEAAEKDGQGG
jgi:hypothetical protein